MEKAPKGVGKGGRKARAAQGRAPAKAPPEAALSALVKGGNDGVRAALADSGMKRDALLQFIAGRLGVMRGVQLAEQAAEGSRRRWFDEVARGRAGFALPDPSRWGEPARLYRRAIDSLCAGDLGRGTDLLRRAHEAELRAMEAVPAQVDVPDGAREAAALPAEAAEGADGQGCPRTSRPELLAQADAIERVAQGARPVTDRPARTHRGWWDLEVEESDADGREGPPGRRRPGEGAPARDRDVGSSARDGEAREETPAPEREEDVAHEPSLAERARARSPGTEPRSPDGSAPPVRDVALTSDAVRRLARRRSPVDPER
jgi:hypothetical protein